MPEFRITRTVEAVIEADDKTDALRTARTMEEHWFDDEYVDAEEL